MKKHLIVDLFCETESDSLTHIKRWSKKPTHHHESVSEHSYDVCVFTSVIIASMTEILTTPSNDRKRQLYSVDELALSRFTIDTLNYATFHDIDERFTGDITHDVKYGNEHGEKMREILKLMIDEMTDEKFNHHPDDSVHNMYKKIYKSEVTHASKFVVKIADWLSMTKFALREVKMGNQYMEEVYWYGVKNLQELCKKAESVLGRYFSQLHTNYYHWYWNLEIFETIRKIDYNGQI